MGFLLLGIVLILLKVFDVGAVAQWPWWLVLLPFPLAILWWTWMDRSGATKRRAAARDAERKMARIERQREQLGLVKGKRRP